MYFPQFDSHSKTISIKDIENLLRKEGLIPNDADLSSVENPCCCEDGNYCICLPETLNFSWYTFKPNRCETCGATDGEHCKTKTNKRTSYHKNRKILVEESK